MHEEIQDNVEISDATLLELLGYPAVINVEKASKLLGFSKDDLAKLVAAGHLKPLGPCIKNSVKIFSRAEIREHARNREWLDAAKTIISKRYRNRKSQRKARDDRKKAKQEAGKTNYGKTEKV